MADNDPQSYEHHTRWDPSFHFFLAPVFVLGLLMTIVHLIAHFRTSDFRENFHACLLILLASALLVAVFKIRLYSLKVQDRVIRLEERLRLATLLPEPLRARIPELTIGQLVALRFASDAELPALATRALNEKLSRADIKKSIKTWRPDNWRV
jgi:Family of unknown function (DUF6526)